MGQREGFRVSELLPPYMSLPAPQGLAVALLCSSGFGFRV